MPDDITLVADSLLLDDSLLKYSMRPAYSAVGSTISLFSPVRRAKISGPEMVPGESETLSPAVNGFGWQPCI